MLSCSCKSCVTREAKNINTPELEKAERGDLARRLYSAPTATPRVYALLRHDDLEKVAWDVIWGIR